MNSSANIKVAPSVLAADWGSLENEISKAEQGGADLIHLDVMDGHFVPPITFGASFVKTIRKLTKLPLDVHLMIEKPDLHIDSFVEAGADIITVHQEACPHLHRALQSIKEKGLKAGVALNPSTPVSFLRPVTELIDLVCLMTVNPGWGGQSFIETSVEKVAETKKLFTNHSIDIEVDGGITPKTAAKVIQAGANILVAGTAVFGSGDYQATISAIRSSKT